MSFGADGICAYRFLTGQEPLPWQRRFLATLFSLPSQQPTALDLPTGLGKTSVMALWLVARASGAAVPRRLVYGVDRRAVVDQATEEAERLRDKLAADGDGPAALRAGLGVTTDRPLAISTLRGQHADNREWLADPSRPAIVVGTVDMIGSRLLFEGYGVSPRMRPVHAALLGVDSLIVLDEAHLVPPFAALVEAVTGDPALAGRAAPAATGIRVPPMRVLALSATGRARNGTDRTLGLIEADRADLWIGQRLRAPKRLRLAAGGSDKPAEQAERLAELAWSLGAGPEGPARVAVFTHSRDVAVRLIDALDKRAKPNRTSGWPGADIATELLVGARRVRERERVKAWLTEHGFLGRTADRKAPPDLPCFLVATSAGEVGIDMDADHLIGDLVPWDRMVQRLGRVNRAGRDTPAEVVVLVPDTRTEETEAARTLTLLQRLPAAPGDGDVPGEPARDASPDALRTVSLADPEAVRAASTPVPLRPALTRPVLEAWSMTSLDAHSGRPDVAPWLRGWEEEDVPRTTLVWRTHLPVDEDGNPVSDGEVGQYLEAAPAHLTEQLETRSDRVLKGLTARVETVLNRKPKASDGGEPPSVAGDAEPVGGVPSPADGEVSDSEPSMPLPPALRPDTVIGFVLDRRRRMRGVLRPIDLRKGRPQAQTRRLERLLAEATVILDARLGGLGTEGLLDDKADAPPVTADGPGVWMPDRHDGSPVVPFRVERVAGDGKGPAPRNWRMVKRFVLDEDEDGVPKTSLVVHRWKDRSSAEEDRSIAPAFQSLEAHADAAARAMRRIADDLALPEALSDRLVLAARHHDRGKAAALWQRAMGAATRPDGPFAKTDGKGGNPRLLSIGGETFRHEFASVDRAAREPAIAALSADDRDLVLHLIAAHHGYARPVIAPVDPDVPPRLARARAAEIALRFARLQDRFGPWGLAWLETLVRAADWHASREWDERAPVEGAPATGPDSPMVRTGTDG